MSDSESVELDDLTLRGGWRLLCVAALHQCVQRLEVEKNLLFRKTIDMRRSHWRKGTAKEMLCQKLGAERWMDGGIGTITFEDACECLEVTPEVARQKILEYVHHRRRRKPNGYLCW